MKIGPREQALRDAREKASAKINQQPPAAITEKKTMQKTSKKTARKPTMTSRRVAAAMKAEKSKKATKSAKTTTEARPGTKLEKIGELLRRPGGCTRKEILSACDWSTVSVQQQAAALGAPLKVEKIDGQNRYSTRNRVTLKSRALMESRFSNLICPSTQPKSW